MNRNNMRKDNTLKIPEICVRYGEGVHIKSK